MAKQQPTAQQQYRTLLKGYLDTKDIRCIFGVATAKSCEMMRELQHYVEFELKKKPVPRRISSKIFIQYYGIDTEDFERAALAEKRLLELSLA